VAEAVGGALQEVAVAGRALGVELEVLHLAVLQDDDLDVLAADVAHHVDVVVEVQRALAVRDRLDDRRVGAEHVAEDVLGVAGGADAEDLEGAPESSTCWRRSAKSSLVSTIGLPLESW
jgi:hypothetical protein